MNPQLLQLLISVIGIAVMVGLCRLLFGRSGAAFTGPADVAAVLTYDVPGFRLGVAALSCDRRGALAEDARNGAIYLAVMRGDGVVTRKLNGGMRVTRAGTVLDFRFPDFSFGRARLDFADAERWEERLRRLAA